MKNYIVIGDKKVELSDETVKSLKEQLNIDTKLESYEDCLKTFEGKDIFYIGSNTSKVYNIKLESYHLQTAENSLSCESRAEQVKAFIKALLVCDTLNGENHYIGGYPCTITIRQCETNKSEVYYSYSRWHSNCRAAGPFYFKSKELAEQFIKIIGKEDLNLIFGYTK